MDGSQGTAGTRRSVGTVVRHHLLNPLTLGYRRAAGPHGA
ncbi:hypothetical protein EDD94_4483 [Streptomyces sp. PanSC9]|nr:hypothetical protein EDD94_4483 [Streptomyces sp. PanSC9]